MPTSAPILNFTAANGVPFAARIIFTGDKFGVGDSLVNEDKPLLEFYDTRQTPTKFGQFVSRYLIETLTDSPIGTGINLQGGVESWQIDGENLKKALDWATKQIGEKIMAEQKYVVDSSNIHKGGVLITRLADQATLFMQPGDDANQFLADFCCGRI